MHILQKILVSLLILLASISSSVVMVYATCNGTPGVSGTVELQVGSTKRIFLLRLPPGYDARSPRPAVLAFHGFTMNAHLMESLVDLTEAWPEALAIYPQGLLRQFETLPVGSQPGWQVTAGEFGDRDLAFVDAMLTWLRENHCLDEKKVYALGYSNGAYFSHLLGCIRPDAIAGLAAAAGGTLCTPTRPRPVILSHGIGDTLVDYEQGVAAARVWARSDGCNAPPENGTAGCTQAGSCANASVVLCSYDGGHTYDNSFTGQAVRFFKNLKPVEGVAERK
jgi:poly(3-hydroxybutyrate) depolymerase